VRFADVATIRALSGQDKVPIVVDGDQVIHDSWNIATHLETRFPDHPSLFGGEVGGHWPGTLTCGRTPPSARRSGG